MSRFILTPRADQDLVDIWEYIAMDDIDAADRWDARVREGFAMLARNPRVGHAREDLTDAPVLFWPIGKYLILYRPLGESIEIVAVTQGSRDIPSYLRKRS